MMSGPETRGEAMTGPPIEHWRHRAPALVLIALSAGFVAWCYAYTGSSRQVPLLVGYLTLGLCLLDLLSRTETGLGARIRRYGGAGFAAERDETGDRGLRELEAMMWIAGFVLVGLFLGLLVAVPLYIFFSMTLLGHKRRATALIAAAATTAFIWVVFEIFMSYELYRGVFLDQRGFHAW